MRTIALRSPEVNQEVNHIVQAFAIFLIKRSVRCRHANLHLNF